MKIKRSIRSLLWLFCTLTVASCGFETVKAPGMGKDLAYHVTRIDEDFETTMDTPFETAAVSEEETSEEASSKDKKTEEVYDYVVGAGDVLLIDLYVLSADGDSGLKRIIPQAPALAEENKFLVNADGSITVPYAGKLQVAGKRFGEVKQLVYKAMSKYFIDPQLEMTVSDFTSSRVLVSGELNKPQELNLTHKPLTVMGAITAAGGVLPTADLRDASITHASGTTEPIDVAAIIYGGAENYNKVLKAGDTLHIPRNHANKIFVMGEVRDPGTITMHPMGMNLTETLSEAKGLNLITGKPSAIYVLREHVGRSEKKREVSVYQLNGSDPESYVYATKFQMQPQDVLYVGSQTITDWNRFINQLLPGGVAGLIQPAPYILN